MRNSARGLFLAAMVAFGTVATGQAQNADVSKPRPRPLLGLGLIQSTQPSAGRWVSFKSFAIT